MAISERYLTETITVTLEITEDTTDTPVQADETPTAEIYLHAQVVESIAASSVSNPSTGEYTFEWEPESTGIHTIVWTWELSDEEYESEHRIHVLADPAGTVSDDVDEDESSSSLSSSRLCTVTANFYDAGGDPLEGVYVRFTPLRSTDSFVSSTIIVQEVDASSDEDGALSMTLVRGVKGTLAITGLGIVREVEVPDTASISLEDLTALADDPLEVQTPEFTSLPRRS